MVSRIDSHHFLVAASLPVATRDDVRSFQVQISGTGRPILLIPGLASSGETWTMTVSHLGNRCRCHVLTLAGFAGTPPTGGPVFATVRRQLAEYIREQDLDRPVVIGHSLGGMLALGLAADHPQLVGPLVIVDALPFMAGAHMQVKSVEEARPVVAKMEAYMSKMTQEQWDGYAASDVSTRYMVTSLADAATLTRWSAATDRHTLTRARLASVLEKARATLVGHEPRSERPRSSSERVFLRDGERCWIVQWGEIVLFEVEGNYARAYFGSHRPLIRVSLNALEGRLDPAHFFRASRQHIVNLRYIESVETAPDDTYVIHLRNKIAVPVSRRQSRQLRENLGL